MSFTKASVYERLRQENPDLEFIVRLYDDRIRRDSRPSPNHFVAKMNPIIRQLKPYATKFEIHNEPNHVDGIEGWGPSDDNARSFRVWYLSVLLTLKKAHPWAKFGFPGLALNHPHRDLVWLNICRDAVQASDWLGCHCYWQWGNMLNDQWGLRFKLYHQRFPDKQIEITEFGNSTPNISREEIARQYVRYYHEVKKFPYLGSANSFLASSPDTAWVPFVWMKEGGEKLPVVDSVRNMDRAPVEIAPPPKPPLPKPPDPAKRTFAETGKTVQGRFLQFFEEYGLDFCGYPITNQFLEQGKASQYFQRLALEQLESGQIKLKLVGAEAWVSRSKIAELETRIGELEQMLVAGGPALPPMEYIVDALPRHPSHRYDSRRLTDIRQIVIHHTATRPTISPRGLAEYQVKKQEKAGILYHFYILADGTIYQTNRLETISDHAFDGNRRSIGICFQGNFSQTVPTVAQIEAGGKLCAWLVSALQLRTEAIMGLCEMADTESPGTQWLEGQRWKERLMAEVETSLEIIGTNQIQPIASMQRKIRILQDQSRETEQQPSVPSFAPAPVPNVARVSKPPIQDLTDKLTKHETKEYETRPLDQIRNLIIHHSAAPAKVGPRRIAAYHVKKQDWPGIGYHFLVGEDGTLYQGNAVETKSYHAVRANPYGVGICFLGNFTKQVPPPAQLRAGAHLSAWLMQELGVELDQVKGHKEFMQTGCPGAQWLKEKEWKKMLYQEIALVQQEAAKTSPAPGAGAKLLHHYMLFWARDGEWAEKDWISARRYIGTFRPTAGFSASDAALAAYVTIVGGPLGVPKEVEEQLVAAGCKVDRIAGKDEDETESILSELARKGRRFQSFEE
jgi:N-acetyl-anhydromuramyl-L-alanine amidase AmpD